MAQVVSAWQDDNGRFHSLPPIRPPLESSDVTATALSLRAIQLYGSQQEERVARAVDWLRAAKPRTTEDHAMQLLGLAWGQARPHDIRKSTASLLALQRQDGGWAQLPTLETDAYATGQALVALQTSGYAVSSSEYQRGVAFLLRTQFPDGSWLVRIAYVSGAAAEGQRIPSRKAPVDLGRRHELGDDGDLAGAADAAAHGGVYLLASFLRIRLIVSGDTPKYDASIRCGTLVAIDGYVCRNSMYRSCADALKELTIRSSLAAACLAVPCERHLRSQGPFR